jgi:uncharacterized membrane protein
VDLVLVPDVSFGELLTAVFLAIALAACAGLRALLPILLTGLVARSGWLELGTSFQFLSSNWALILFGTATVLEIVGDKIPAVDHALDVFHTFLRPLSGSMLAAAVLSSVSDPATAIALGIIVGAPTALVPHAARATARIVSTATTGGLANPVLSVVEDVGAFGLFVFAVVLPLLAGGLVLLLSAWLVWRLLRRRSRRTPVTA